MPQVGAGHVTAHRAMCCAVAHPSRHRSRKVPHPQSARQHRPRVYRARRIPWWRKSEKKQRNSSGGGPPKNTPMRALNVRSTVRPRNPSRRVFAERPGDMGCSRNCSQRPAALVSCNRPSLTDRRLILVVDPGAKQLQDAPGVRQPPRQPQPRRQ